MLQYRRIWCRQFVLGTTVCTGSTWPRPSNSPCAASHPTPYSLYFIQPVWPMQGSATVVDHFARNCACLPRRIVSTTRLERYPRRPRHPSGTCSTTSLLSLCFPRYFGGFVLWVQCRIVRLWLGPVIRIIDELEGKSVWVCREPVSEICPTFCF